MTTVNGRPQVSVVPIDGSAPRTVTSAAEGVFGYEWSPDGRQLAYLTRDPMPDDETRARQDRSFVMRADAPDRPTRIVLKDADGAFGRSRRRRISSMRFHGRPTAASSPTRRRQGPVSRRRITRESIGVALDGSAFAEASADKSAPRTIVDRTGTNSGPRYSPDGRWVAFISTDGRVDIMAPRSLAIAPVGAASGSRLSPGAPHSR